MAEHIAIVEWTRGTQPFADKRFSRAHTWTFDGGLTVPASAAPSVVPVPMSDPAGVDPEEAYVAALSSCHMLTFLWVAVKAGFVVDHYRDRAVGVLGKNADGRLAVLSVTLHPAVRFAGRAPTAAELDALHHQAHHDCFIAQSVKTEVRCEPQAAA